MAARKEGKLSNGKKPKPIRRRKVIKAVVSLPEKTPSRRKTPEAAAARAAWERERIHQLQTIQRTAARDIYPLDTSQINWERRLSCKKDLKLFGKTYLPSVFYLSISSDHERIIHKGQTVILEGGQFALAMPRGQGKTAWCRCMMIWATAYGHRMFPFFIGPKHDKACQTLDFIKTYWYRSPELLQDFPEIAYPIRRLENRHHLASGQLFNGEPTQIEWGTETIRFPSYLLTEEDAKDLLANDPTTVTEVNGRFMPRQCGVIVRTNGIDGSIRGEAEVHPILLEQPRPDLVLLDDIQKDANAESPIQCDKLIRLVDGAVQGLAGPGKLIACLMPCTVQREGDVSDTYLDILKKPEWRGERCSMVTSWPEGITDHDISLTTPAGKLWNEYSELRRESLRIHGDLRMATEFYLTNREAMDKNFTVSWADRYNSNPDYGYNTEVSAQQHAMNLRLTSPLTFPGEFQNRPRSLLDALPIITPGELAERTTGLDARCLPHDTHCVVSFIDVQNEILFYVTLAVAQDFSGVITDYGTWPEVHTRYFRRGQTEGWSLLSREFFLAYPQHKIRAEITEKGIKRAPFEAKIYFAVQQLTRLLLAREYNCGDQHNSRRFNAKIGIDARYGKASDCIKRFIQDTRNPNVLPVFGRGITPAQKQFEEYQSTRGWLFEHQVHPGLQESKWLWRPGPDGAFYLETDVSRLKTFLLERLSCPKGSPGAITLYDAVSSAHEMFADHVAGSEYPEKVTARGRDKDIWMLREHKPDNDYLDAAAGCIALASMAGARLRPSLKAPTIMPPRRKLSEIWQEKRNGTVR